MASAGKGRICEAFMRLSARKSVSKITVTDVIAEAGINRSSFYYHFHTIEDVLQYMIELFAQRVRECYANMDIFEESDVDDLNAAIVPNVQELAEFFYENRTIFLYLCEGELKARFYDALVDAIVRGLNGFTMYFETSEGNLFNLSRYEQEIHCRFIAFQQLAIWDAWAANGFSEDPERCLDYSYFLSFKRFCMIVRSSAYPKPHSIGIRSMAEEGRLLRPNAVKGS